MRVIDISQPLGPTTAVWPGDRPVELEWTLRRERGDSVNVAALAASVHAGTHADGPLHVLDGAAGAAEVPLDAFLGPAVVVDARGHATLGPELLEALPETVERVLFRTRERIAPEVFPQEVAPVTAALAHRLVERSVRLIGTDAPSIDPLDSKTLDAHRILARAGVVNLENLVLDRVEPGPYWLVALPLRLQGADSAPVRAALIEGPPER